MTNVVYHIISLFIGIKITIISLVLYTYICKDEYYEYVQETEPYIVQNGYCDSLLQNKDDTIEKLKRELKWEKRYR